MGFFDSVKGKINEIMGQVTGDKTQEVTGKAQQLAEDLKNQAGEKVEDLKNQATEKVNQVIDDIQNKVK